MVLKAADMHWKSNTRQTGPYVNAQLTLPKFQPPLLRKELKVSLPPHMTAASKFLRRMIRELVSKQMNPCGEMAYLPGAMQTEIVLKKIGQFPQEFTVEEISRIIRKVKLLSHAGGIGLPDSTVSRAIGRLKIAEKIAHFKDMIETCSVSAANEYFQFSESGKGLRGDAIRYERLIGVIDYLMRHDGPDLAEEKKKRGVKSYENPKMKDVETILNERVERRCLVLCNTEEQKRALSHLAAKVCPSAVIANHVKGINVENFDTIILYNPDKHEVKKAWEDAGREIIVLIALGTRDDAYWNQAKTADIRIREAHHAPGFGKQLALF